ncbi:hypothetical protein BU24DRAFT_425777 [Aaosphaeria arxii CBS 175.79]|uniref:Uncharacterized protein n=1 Tax=Aaosphaeria arxii CBS 175.79 TaxID=1450172 RepID=A0A6A5XGJ9_9PLEO|nr:uncharacterized protein BU24DRAFT_425777 [Aaosphaeria arxii CBS 175.79]KAF2011951.1 hypothetical protein BU24DRAFT_425777 [Aaosphaeria arxii CBS 175.79]
MAIDSTQRLHWTQRVALVRHNLHAARRTGDYTFFKTLQAHALIDGTDHVSILHTVLGNDADHVLSTLDNLNAGIAYVHQDAFKAVYDGAKSTMYKADNSPASRRSLLRVDICQQRDMADHAIDKTANSAVNLIEAQPVHCQDAVANAWITGTTIISDAVCVCLAQMEEIEENIDDFIRLEYAWSSIQNSVDAAISALRGIFNLMATSNPRIPVARTLSVSSSGGQSEPGSLRSRASSTTSAFNLIKRAFSHSQMQPPPASLSSSKSSRPGSVSLPMPDSTARGFRLSMSTAFPTRMPDHHHTQLTPVPHTPSVHDTPGGLSPFNKESNEYFSFDMEKESESGAKKSSVEEDLMQLENLDPLYSPALEQPIPLAMRRASATLASANPPIAV